MKCLLFILHLEQYLEVGKTFVEMLFPEYHVENANPWDICIHCGEFDSNIPNTLTILILDYSEHWIPKNVF